MNAVIGNVLPVYLVIDESRSMEPVVDELNKGLLSLHEALLLEPMAAARVRFSIIGFAEDAVVRLALADLRHEAVLPTISTRNSTCYGAAFAELRSRIPADVTTLRDEGYAVHRPAVFFLTDGQPTDGGAWEPAYELLVDRESTRAAPNIIACGIGQARAETILHIATRPEFAFITTPGAEVGLAIAELCAALTHSIVASGRAVGAPDAELVVRRPGTFRMALEVV